MSSFATSGLSYLLFLIIAGLSLYLPYHTSFISLVLFGSWHISSEYTHWFYIKKIFRKPKKYPVIVFAGALILSGMTLQEIFSHAENPLLSGVLRLALIGLWLPLAVLPVQKKKSIKQMFTVFLIFILPPLIWFYPFIAAFLLVHVHNFIPWIFVFRDTEHVQKKYFIFKAVVLSIFIPFFSGGLWLYYGFEISQISLGGELEIDIYRHVLTPDQTMGTLLLSLFAYQQILHYWLWIAELPGIKNRMPWQELWRWIPEVTSLLGFRAVREKYFIPVPFLLIAANVFLFAFFPVEWRRIYFILATFHILMEWPLVFLK